MISIELLDFRGYTFWITLANMIGYHHLQILATDENQIVKNNLKNFRFELNVDVLQVDSYFFRA